MATADNEGRVPSARWRDQPSASLVIFVLAWPVGFCFALVAVLLSLGGSSGHTDQASRSILAEVLALVFMALAGLLPSYGLWMARQSLQRQSSVVGWLGLGLNAAALIFLASILIINTLELLDVVRVQTQ